MLANTAPQSTMVIMSEKLDETIERLELSSLRTGDTVHITLGQGDEAYQYTFKVAEPGKWPTGIITETSPDGSENAGEFSLHGSGRWTNRQQNPVQTQERAFTSYFDSLTVGSFMVGAVPNAPIGDRLIFDRPGQEITDIRLR